MDEKIELIEKQLFLSKNMKETEYLIEDIYDILLFTEFHSINRE